MWPLRKRKRRITCKNHPPACLSSPARFILARLFWVLLLEPNRADMQSASPPEASYLQALLAHVAVYVASFSAQRLGRPRPKRLRPTTTATCSNARLADL